MKLKIWPTLAVVVLLMVGCGASATPVDESGRPGESTAPASQAIQSAQPPTVGDNPQAQEPEEPGARLTILQKLERDYIAEQLLVEADAIAREISKSGTRRDYYQEVVRLYVPVYMAEVCVKGSQPFAQGFTAITRANLSAGRGPDVEAVRVIKAMKDVGETATQQCLQPYLHPESISDASPAVDLFLASRVMALPFDLRDSFKSVVMDMAAGWFQTDRQESFIFWMCKKSDANLCEL